VVVARCQKAARGLLMALGIGIFAIAFTLVTLNVSYTISALRRRIRCRVELR